MDVAAVCASLAATDPVQCILYAKNQDYSALYQLVDKTVSAFVFLQNLTKQVAQRIAQNEVEFLLDFLPQVPSYFSEDVHHFLTNEIVKAIKSNNAAQNLDTLLDYVRALGSWELGIYPAGKFKVDTPCVHLFQNKVNYLFLLKMVTKGSESVMETVATKAKDVAQSEQEVIEYAAIVNMLFAKNKKFELGKTYPFEKMKQGSVAVRCTMLTFVDLKKWDSKLQYEMAGIVWEDLLQDATYEKNEYVRTIIEKLNYLSTFLIKFKDGYFDKLVTADYETDEQNRWRRSFAAATLRVSMHNERAPRQGDTYQRSLARSIKPKESSKMDKIQQRAIQFIMNSKNESLHHSYLQQALKYIGLNGVALMEPELQAQFIRKVFRWICKHPCLKKYLYEIVNFDSVDSYEYEAFMWQHNHAIMMYEQLKDAKLVCIFVKNVNKTSMALIL